MLANLRVGGGLVGSSAALLALVDAGWSREDAYAVVQRAAMAAWAGLERDPTGQSGTGEAGTTDGDFRALLLAEPGVAAALPAERLDEALDPARFVAGLGPLFDRVEKLP
jgi:adenylosuccinate lyase